MKLLLDELRHHLGEVGRLGVALLEQRRNAPYRSEHKCKLARQLSAQAEQRVRIELREALSQLPAETAVLPVEPTEGLERYAAAVGHVEYGHVTMKFDAPCPTKSESHLNFDRENARLVERILGELKAHGVDWSSDNAKQRMAAELVEGMCVRRAGQRAPRKTGAPVERPRALVGDGWLDEIPQGLRGDARRTARELLGVDLVFGDELGTAYGTLASRARENESFSHRESVRLAAGLLRRLGYSVYPGDVGVERIRAMADLVAWDGDVIWFVECLTKASIEKGGHLSKLALAERVPFCFVGELPDAVVRDLPSNAFVLTRADAAFTSRDELCPPFWRRNCFAPVRLDLRLRSDRKLMHLELSMPNLRLEEDVAGFLWCAFFRGRAVFRKPDVKVRIPRAPIGLVPFPRTGKPSSKLRVVAESTELEIRLGSLPVTVQLWTPIHC